MTNHILNELTDVQMDTVSGGCGHRDFSNRGLMGGLGGLLAVLGRVQTNTNISIIIISNSTINAPLTIQVSQKIA